MNKKYYDFQLFLGFSVWSPKILGREFDVLIGGKYNYVKYEEEEVDSTNESKIKGWSMRLILSCLLHDRIIFRGGFEQSLWPTKLQMTWTKGRKEDLQPPEWMLFGGLRTYFWKKFYIDVYTEKIFPRDVTLSKKEIDVWIFNFSMGLYW